MVRYVSRKGSQPVRLCGASAKRSSCLTFREEPLALCLPSRALINKQFCRHSTEGSRDPAPVAGSSGQTLGRGSRVSATAILRRNPDGANRARDNRYGNGRSLGCKWRRLTPSRGNYSNLMLDQFGSQSR